MVMSSDRRRDDRVIAMREVMWVHVERWVKPATTHPVNYGRALEPMDYFGSHKDVESAASEAIAPGITAKPTPVNPLLTIHPARIAE